MSVASPEFAFEVPVSFFEKAGAGPGRERRIGGLISSDTEDQQGEEVLQEGLDVQPFLRSGWFNDNHSRSTADILGYPDPDALKRFRKGDVLPDGTIAKGNGTWAEGYMLDTPQATKVWELGKALQRSGRSLGFSVEGGIVKRAGPKTVAKKSADGRIEYVGKRVVKAIVRNVAITGSPVQQDSRLSILAKSLEALEAEAAEAEKALTMGPGSPNPPVGPRTGEGAGAVLTPESLERKKRKDESEKDKAKKSLTPAQAVEYVMGRLNIGPAAAGRIVEATQLLKRRGRL